MTDSRRGMPVQKTASLHEKAVQAVARGRGVPTPRQPRKRAENRSGPVELKTPVPSKLLADTIEELLGREGYPYSKVEIRSEVEAVIR